MDPSSIEISNIKKKFGTQDVLKGVSLSIGAGEFVCLLGPSGCGKSTLLRILAGLEQQDEGNIIISGRDVSRIPPKSRDIAMVFQSFALYPHLTVGANIAAPLVMSRLSFMQRQLPMTLLTAPGRRIRRMILEDVKRVARQLQIENLLQRKPAQLSGGQKQRVAIGRAIVRHPRLFLMDEPLSNLDAGLRTQMRGELVELQKRLGITTIFVTHDQTEAMSMADRIVVMMEGKVLQEGSPLEVFNDPHHVQVAKFIGSPAINLLPARGIGKDKIICFGQEIATKCNFNFGEQIEIGIRPENLKFDRQLISNGSLSWSALVERVETLGHETLLFLALDYDKEPKLVARLTAEAYAKLNRPMGRKLQVSFDISDAHFFDLSGLRKNPARQRHAETEGASKQIVGLRK